jgi:hypothetical protein
MASYLPPTENLPIFDNQSFTQNNEALTYAEAKKYFVTFPTSQGTTTITDLIAGEIDYSSPSSGSFFNIGTNQVSGGTVRVGPTGGSSGVSVHAGNFDFKNNTVNNATAPLTGGISICDAQTSGILNIATNVGRSGDLNINNTEGADNAINIGATGTTTTQKGLILAGSNTYYSGGSTTITEYIGGGLSTYNSGIAIAVNLNDFILNKNLDMTFSGNDTQSLAFPTAPNEGQVIKIRTGKHGGVITMTTTQRLFASNTNLLTAQGIVGGTTITLQNIETYMFTYIGARWIQMNDSLNPLVDSDLSIGSTILINDVLIATNQTSGGTITIGSANSVTTFAGGLSVSKAITLPTATLTPTTTQLGYTLSNSVGPSVAITTATGLLSVTNTAIGIYILTYDINVDNCTSGAGSTLTFTFPVTGGCTVTHLTSTLLGATVGQSTGASYTGVLKCTTATNGVTMFMACSPGSAIARTYKSTIIKIA